MATTRNTVADLGLPLARERATDDVPRRAAATRAEWQPLVTLGTIVPEWRDLVARALEPNVFYDPAFALAAAPVFGTRVGAVLVRSKGRLIGLFPARIDRRYGLISVLTGWTHPYAPLGVPLVDRDDADVAIGAFLDHLGGRLALFPMMTQDGAFATVLRRVLARHGGRAAFFDTHARALLVPEGERSAYLDHALAHKKLKELRRQRRRLAETAPVTLATAHEPAAVAAALTDFLTLEASGWKGRAGTAVLEHPPIRAFLEAALPGLAADGNARVDRLLHGGRPLAATITLRSGDTEWFWKIAYLEEFARYSPGVQLTSDVTRQLLADPTVARVDSCATAGHPMIDHLWRERLAITDLLIAPGPETMTAFNIARRLETVRRGAFALVKRLLHAVRGR